MLTLIIQNADNGEIYDVSELIIKAELSYSMHGQAGRLDVELLQDELVNYAEGSQVSLKANEDNLFYGYLFTKGIKENENVTITCYDQLRYLRNKDTYVLKEMTSGQVVEKLCKDFNLKYKVIDDASRKISPRIHDNKTLYEIIDYGLTEILVNDGQWLIIRDNNGTIEQVDVETLKSDIIIGDESLLTAYDYESSIDKDTFNQVKLVRENEETEKREVYIVKDSSTINKWGVLQYFEHVDERVEEDWIEERCEAILRLKNKPSKRLRIKAIGHLEVREGVGVVISIEALKTADNVQEGHYIVESVKHRFEDELYTMDLEVISYER